MSPGSKCNACASGPWHSFAELVNRVFRLDVLKCARGGSQRRWIAAITSGEGIAKILEHLDLPSVVIDPAPARGPPQPEFGFGFEGG